MRKKISAILTTLLVAMVLLVTLVSCQRSQAVDFFQYSTKNLGAVGNLVRLMHGWIGNYGWTVVVFTVFLKIVMLPIDFWQRYSARKSAIKMQRIQPLMEAIDKRYGANTQRANEEKQKLYKKQGYSMLSTCLPMILSMVIFFVMFAGLRNYSTYSTITTFRDLSTEYYATLEKEYEKMGGDIYAAYKAEFDARKAECLSKPPEDMTFDSQEDLENYAILDARIKGVEAANRANNKQSSEANKVALERVQQLYLEEKESWLWLKNVWQPDTWATVMPAFSGGTNSFSTSINMKFYPDGNQGANTYNTIRDAILQVDGYGNNGTWNGLMILPILSIGLSFLSMFISQRLERRNRKGQPAPEQTAQNQQQQMTNKMMMIMMPLMMAVFGFMYTGAFAIYMVANYAISILTTIGMRYPVEKLLEKNLAKDEKKEKSGKASYMR